MNGLVRGLALLLTVALGATGCGDEGPTADPLDDPFETVERATPDPDAPRRAAPRWEEVLTLSGDGPATEEFPIPEDALQWRVRYSCESGELTVAVDALDDPLATTDCPDQGEAFAIVTGFVELEVVASGPYQVTVEQQVDTVHEEPPLDGMAEAAVLAEGGFYGIERSGEGTATLYRMPDGALALRFTDFQTVASPDLFVWLSTADTPTTSEEVFQAEHTSLGEITSTLGDQNYVLPADIDPAAVRSVVIWCAPLQIAYAAAGLEHRPAP